MLRILAQMWRVGLVTEPAPKLDEKKVSFTGAGVDPAAARLFHKSLSIRQVDAGSCNGCELEIHALNNPIYGCERYGARFTASPRHADMLMVTGPVTRNMTEALKRTYDATPDPKLVAAVGDCAINGGVFGESYASMGGVEKVIPVNICVSGCPPSPADILSAILAVMDPSAGSRRD